MYREKLKETPYQFTELELRQGCRKCIQNVKGLLDSALLLAKNESSLQYALGLYIYAVEEYGKAILLKQPIKGKNQNYAVKPWVFGRGKKPEFNEKVVNYHDRKIIEGFDNLPFECRFFSNIIVVAEPVSQSTLVTINKGKISGRKSKVNILGSGKYEDTVNTYPFDYHLDLKTGSFYIDWNIEDKKWNYAVTTQKKELVKVLKIFRRIIDKFEVNLFTGLNSKANE